MAAICGAFSTFFAISRVFCRLNISDCRSLTLTSDSHREEEMIPVPSEVRIKMAGNCDVTNWGHFDHFARIFSKKRTPFRVFFSERNILLLDF